jgi:hypothetical protein
LEGRPRQETGRRRCWSIVEGRRRRRGTLPTRPTGALCSRPGASSRPCDAPASRRPSLLPETRTQGFENTLYVSGRTLTPSPVRTSFHSAAAAAQAEKTTRSDSQSLRSRLGRRPVDCGTAKKKRDHNPFVSAGLTVLSAVRADTKAH